MAGFLLADDGPDRAQPGGRSGRLGTAAGFLAVAFGAMLLALPGVLAGVGLAADSVGYVAAAYNWLEGRGLVDPIVYSYYLPDLRPPAPAMLIRPPLVSLLFAVPLALGAGIPGLARTHAVFSSLIGAAGVCVARRTQSLPAALAFGIAVAWSPSWVSVSRRLLTESTACGVVLLVLALVRGFPSAHRRALLLAAALWLGWLTRPNLVLLLPALLGAAALELGPRAALRARPLWTLLLGFLALQQATSLAFASLHGLPAYAHYGVMLELIDVHDVAAYRKEYVGVLAFMQAHPVEIASVLDANLRQYVHDVFAASTFTHVGWLALPALLHALLRRGRGSLERRVAGIAGLLFTVSALLIWGGFDPVRYPLPGVVCLWFAACGLLDDVGRLLAERLQRRGAAPRLAWPARMLPLLVVLALWMPENAARWARTAPTYWSAYRLHGTEVRETQWQRVEHEVRSLCASLDPDAIVASVEPWEIYLWCGNAGFLLPRDLGSVEWVDRYLEDRAPGYVVSDDAPAFEPFAASNRLRRVAHAGRLTLYEVRDAASRSRPWRAPPPLLGREAGAER